MRGGGVACTESFGDALPTASKKKKTKPKKKLFYMQGKGKGNAAAEKEEEQAEDIGKGAKRFKSRRREEPKMTWLAG